MNGLFQVFQGIRSGASALYKNPPSKKTLVRFGILSTVTIGTLAGANQIYNKYHLVKKASDEGRHLLALRGIEVQEKRW